MAKIAQASSKYIVTASINIEGVVDRPDVIGAVFGQTEGLLGADLELRELQRSGRIGRIEVNVTTKSGKTTGEVIIPSSLDKAETAIVGAALEVIQRIGPCNAHLHVNKIEDVRISKRQQVIERAKELLSELIHSTMPDSQELADEVVNSVRVMEITEWGKDRLAAGPGIDEAEEITLVEGRADVITLLRHGFKNIVAINGTSMPPSIIDLCKQKVVTVFVDGDRGGDLIVKELMQLTEIDFITKAPDGKEVEELTKKEIHKCLRSKIATEQYNFDTTSSSRRVAPRKTAERAPARTTRTREPVRAPRTAPAKAAKLSSKEKSKFSEMLEDLIGTHGAYILDPKLNILGKVPATELLSTIKSLRTGMHAVILDGSSERDLAEACERNGVDFLVSMTAKVKSTGRLQILTADDL